MKPLIERIATAIAWGHPDNESTGYTNSELISLLSEAYKLIKNQPVKAEPAPLHVHDEINIPETDEVVRLTALVESTQKLLAVRVREAEELIRDRNAYRIKAVQLQNTVESLRISGKDEAKRRIEKIEKHLSALKETING